MKRVWFLVAAAAALQGMAHAQQIIGVGNLSRVVTNLDRSLELYRDGFGPVVTTPPGPFEANPAIERLGDMTVAQSRRAEYRWVDRPVQARIQDPGTSILQLNVRGLDALLPKLIAAGFTVVSTGGRPWEFNGDRLVLLRDPNNLFLELIEPQRVL